MHKPIVHLFLQCRNPSARNVYAYLMLTKNIYYNVLFADMAESPRRITRGGGILVRPQPAR